jgi:HD-GYP domain-containing protein (c-di-GMP phosphodiesterase class II)
VRPCDQVCRYGGEEFCILLPHVGIDQAADAAERYRAAVEGLVLPGFSVTVSLGVAAVTESCSGPQELVDQADKCLYIAKRNGRNQFVRHDRQPVEVEVDPKEISRARDTESQHDLADGMSLEIPFHAVSALISALAYRDVMTAEHSRRVADLCVLVAQDMMSARKCYILETAGLLHDIGKIGVPDSILLKPGPLTDEEWKVMGIHDRVGVEIIASAFSCTALTEIIQNHHAWYDGKPRETALPVAREIPLGARILAIADAYDAMVSDRVYRKGRTQAEAFEELRRFKGRQFDPDLVDRFIAVVEARYEPQSTSTKPLSRQAAVQFGRQIERLAESLDGQDTKTLGMLAGRIQQSARQYGEPQLAHAAADVQRAVIEEADLVDLVTLTNELMSLCRSTQGAFLERIQGEQQTDASSSNPSEAADSE